MTRPSKFEQDSTKAPLWLPIAGLLVFVGIVLLALLGPDAGAPAGRRSAEPSASEARPGAAEER